MRRSNLSVFGFVDTHGNTLQCGCHIFVVFPSISLEEESLAGLSVITRSLNIQTTRLHIWMVGNLVVANVVAVEHDIHEEGSGIELHTHKAPHDISGQSIADERLVVVICHQDPVLVGHALIAQQAHLFAELHAVGLLAGIAAAEGGISPAADLHVCESHHLVAIDHLPCGVDEVLLRGDGSLVLGLDIDRRQVCQLCVLLSNQRQAQKQQEEVVKNAFHSIGIVFVNE